MKQIEALTVASDMRDGDGITQRLVWSDAWNRLRAYEVRAASVRLIEQRRDAVGIDDDRAALIDAEREDGARIRQQAIVENTREKDDGAPEAVARDEVGVGDRVGERRPCEEPGREADARLKGSLTASLVVVSSFRRSPATES